MDLEVLKKKISIYRTQGGYLKSVSDELLMEILSVWETWTGPNKGFYTAIGVDQKKMASIIGKAKKLKREGYFPTETFKEIKFAEAPLSSGLSMQGGIEMSWVNGKVIRFSEVTQLVEFLDKASQSQCETCEVKKAG